MIPKHADYKNVLITQIQGYDDFYTTCSFNEKGETTLSFHVVAKDKKHYIEWETRYGPITILAVYDSRNPKTLDEMEEEDLSLPQKSYFFEKTYSRGSWTQLAVDGLDLKGDLKKGDYQSIYEKLKGYLPT